MLIDETGLFLNPLVRRTWSPVGRTPVYLGPARHRERVSVIGAVAVSPRARRLSFYFDTAPNGYFGPDRVVAFLGHLLRHLRGPVVVVWDGGGNHKGPAIRAFLRRNTRLTLERLPAYAPALNPVEAVWSWLKYGQLCNFVAKDAKELTKRITERLVALQSDPKLIRQLWKGSGLPFPDARKRTQRE